MPTDPNDPLSQQKLKDRYYGTNDPVAEKLLKQASEMPKLSAPDDKTITSLYIGGMDEAVTEKDLRWVDITWVVLYTSLLHTFNTSSVY